MTDQPRYFSIGHVSEKIGVDQSCVRYWETHFKIPVKKKSGFRYYTSENIEALLIVKHLLKEEMYTMKGAKRQIKIRGLKYFDL